MDHQNNFIERVKRWRRSCKKF